MRRQSIWRSGLAMAMGVSIVLAVAARGWAQADGQAGAAQSKTDPKINDAFKRPDVKAYIKRFETEDREVYARRHEIVAALGLKTGMAVADIGAGTGLFTRLMAEKVGVEGKVYAVDIAQEFLEHIAADAKKHGRKQIVTVHGNQETTQLRAESLDLVFMSDVYHHLERPERMLASIRQALKPGGKLVVVEFDRVPGRSSEFVLKHVRAGKDVFIGEIESAGFRRANDVKGPVLKENFLAAFEKVSATDRPAEKPRRRSR
jgi:ubiquinone/menaquinone biosynthesis C-methylase UbiE